jgi:hypothetical protein
MKKLKEIKNALQRDQQWLLGNTQFIWGKVKIFFSLLWRFIKNVWFLYFRFKSKPLVFSGWLHFWFSRKYADKRTRLSNHQKILGGGKRHHVIAWDKESLVVINRLELNDLKSRGIVPKTINIIWLIEHAYYTSK